MEAAIALEADNQTKRKAHPYLVSVTPQVSAMLDAGCVVAIGASGGKDGTAAAIRLDKYLNAIGHTGPRLLIHADLGSVEWKDSLPVCQRLSEQIGWELVVVRRNAGDMMQRWQKRWADNVARYANLECMKLILPWSTPQWRFCTSELKVDQITRYLSKRFKGQDVLSVTGIRHQESARRAKMPIANPEAKLSKNGATGLNWNPIITWSTEEVFSYIAAMNGPLHEAYTVYGSTRVSCVFCIMASKGDLAASVSCQDNHDIYHEIVELEATSSFALQGASWLADLAPYLLSESLVQRVQRAKVVAQRRELLESQIPDHLLYTKGWPTVLPTMEEATLIAQIRVGVAEALNLDIQYTDAESVQRRFAELLDKKETKARSSKGKRATTKVDTL